LDHAVLIQSILQVFPTICNCTCLTVSSMQQTQHRQHVTLLGDSILDNKAYTGGGPCVTEHLEFKLRSQNWQVTNCAVDGDVVQDVIDTQIQTIPDTSTVLVVSAGGNDGLQLLSELEHESVTLCNVSRKLKILQTQFRDRYAMMLRRIESVGLPIIICTVYHPCFEHNEILTQTISSIGVTLLNRVIRSEAKRIKAPVVDLAWIFHSRKDYANAIEPSSWGGDKISNNIIKVLNEHDFKAGFSKTYWSRLYSTTLTPGMASGDRRDASRLAKAAKNEGFRNRA